MCIVKWVRQNFWETLPALMPTVCATAAHCDILQKHCNTYCYRHSCPRGAILQDTAHVARLCKTLYHSARRCKTLQDVLITARMPTGCALQHTATHRQTLEDTALHCITLQDTARHCKTLHYTATHCKTLQHVLIPARMPTGCATATHCKILKDTVTHTATSTHAHGVCNGAAILHINYIRWHISYRNWHLSCSISYI